MEKEFATAEIAFKMRELGFDEPCMGYRTEYGSFSMKMKVTNSKLDKERARYRATYKGTLPDMAAAPLWQQVFRWFKERGYELSEITIFPEPFALTFIESEKEYMEMSKAKYEYKDGRYKEK